MPQQSGQLCQPRRFLSSPSSETENGGKGAAPSLCTVRDAGKWGVSHFSGKDWHLTLSRMLCESSNRRPSKSSSGSVEAESGCISSLSHRSWSRHCVTFKTVYVCENPIHAECSESPPKPFPLGNCPWFRIYTHLSNTLTKKARACKVI